MARLPDMSMKNGLHLVMEVIRIGLLLFFLILFFEILIDHREKESLNDKSQTVDGDRYSSPISRVVAHYYRVGDFIRNYLSGQHINILGSIQNEDKKRDTKEEAL